MKLSNLYPPHIRSGESNFTIMRDIIIVMLPLYFLTLVYYGWRSIILMILSVLVAVICDVACQLLAQKRLAVADLSAVVTGMLIPLMFSAATDYYVVMFAAMFAILVAKHPFGGLGKNIFNPAAAGVAFACVSFAEKIFSYPLPLDKPDIITGVFAKVAASPLSKLKLGGAPSHAVFDMLLGNFPGPMGATNLLVLLSCFIYLVVRKTINPKPGITFVGVCALFAFLFPRINSGRIESVIYELAGGCLLFAAVFLINDPVTSPKRETSKIIYAALLAVVTMLFRYYGGYEEGIFFAILIMNSFVWAIDVKMEEQFRKRRNTAVETPSEEIQ